MPQGHSNFAVTCPTSNYASQYTLPAVLWPCATHKQGVVATLDSVALNSPHIALIRHTETTCLSGTVILQ